VLDPTDQAEANMTDQAHEDARSTDEEITKASPDGAHVSVEGAKTLLDALVADVQHAINHNAPSSPGWVDRIKQALTHLGG
jgi:hypothetical protein